MAMTSCLLTFLLATIASCAQVRKQTTSDQQWPLRDIFLVAGQSNARGHGRTDELPDDFKEPPAHMLAWMNHRVGTVDSKWDWSPFEIGPPAYEYDGLYLQQLSAPTWKPFGPELAFGHELEKHIYGRTKESFGIVKVAVMSTSLRYNWTATPWDPKNGGISNSSTQLRGVRNLDAVSKIPDTPGYLLEHLIQQAKDAVNSDQCDGKCRLKALVWVQGEKDSEAKEDSELYFEELKDMIARLRLELDAPNLYVLIAELIHHEGSPEELQQKVREAQLKFTTLDGNAALASSSGIPHCDGIHYGTKGQVEIGQRLANMYLQHVK